MAPDSSYNEKYSGVDVSFLVNYTTIPENKKETARNEFFNNRNNSFCLDTASGSAQIFPHIDREKLKSVDPFLITSTFYLFQSIKRLEDKIESLSQQKNTDSPPKTTIYDAKCTRISGDGLILQSRHEIRRGELLKINIVLPEYPPYIITTLGETIKVIKEQTENKSQALFFAIITFDSIFEDDQDEIFRFVTEKKREMIRNSKNK